MIWEQKGDPQCANENCDNRDATDTDTDLFFSASLGVKTLAEQLCYFVLVLNSFSNRLNSNNAMLLSSTHRTAFLTSKHASTNTLSPGGVSHTNPQPGKIRGLRLHVTQVV